MTPDQILDLAADRIDERGWVQGSGCEVDRSKGDCALSAIGALSWGHADSSSAAIYAMHKATGCHVVHLWNDAPGRTKEEVTSTLRAVAATIRAQRGVETLPVTDEREVGNAPRNTPLETVDA